MYLSRLILNPRSRRAQSESADPYQLHRTVMRAFPETLPPDERVLFRLDTDRQSGVFTLLVQSLYEPQWDWLANGYGAGYLLDLPDQSNPGVKEFDPLFSIEQQLIFRLRANPTVKRDGKRIAVIHEEDQIAWLQRKAQQGGFIVQSVRVQSQGYARGHTRQGNALTLNAVQYEGILQVTEPDAFWYSVANGIGSAKGMGFGLLSLARAGTMLW